jgi:hypothetical protein
LTVEARRWPTLAPSEGPKTKNELNLRYWALEVKKEKKLKEEKREGFVLERKR